MPSLVLAAPSHQPIDLAAFVRRGRARQDDLLQHAVILSHSQATRSLLAHQLRQMGVQHLRYARKPAEARALLESAKRLDLVVVDHDIHSRRGHDGHDVVDELRQCGLLPLSTIVVVVASRATYQQVCEAAEAGIDTYLLFPFAHNTLQRRLEVALTRRRDLAEVYDALQRRDHDAALQACLVRMGSRAPFWLYCARIAAEIYIARGQAQQAQQLYEEILRHEALPWARLGVGRALIEQGRHESAIEVLGELIEQDSTQIDAYDLMGRAYLECGQTEEALRVYRLAAQATPSSISRLQRLGFAAYYAGDLAAAIDALQRSLRQGARSKTFDLQAIFVLADIYALQRPDAKALEDLRRAFASLAGSPVHEGPRLAFIGQCLEFFEAARQAQWSLCQQIAEEAAQRIADDLFDFDSGCNLVRLLSILRQAGKPLAQAEELVRRIGLRFAHSRLAAEWLAKAAEGSPDYAEQLRRCTQDCFEMAQSIIRKALQQDDKTASATELLELARGTLNARIIESAQRYLERYRPNIRNAEALAEQLQAIVATNDPVRLKRNPSRHLRHPGGISLKG